MPMLKEFLLMIPLKTGPKRERMEKYENGQSRTSSHGAKASAKT